MEDGMGYSDEEIVWTAVYDCCLQNVMERRGYSHDHENARGLPVCPDSEQAGAKAEAISEARDQIEAGECMDCGLCESCRSKKALTWFSQAESKAKQFLHGAASDSRSLAIGTLTLLGEWRGALHVWDLLVDAHGASADDAERDRVNNAMLAMEGNSDEIGYDV